MHIPFNRPYLPYNSIVNMVRSAMGGTISGNGKYTKKCHRFFEERYGFRKVLLTTSCTDALEMAGLLCDLRPGDEVILPSFTFMSTANAFLLRNAKVVLADTLPEIPNIDPLTIEPLITPKTRAIAVVHYSGVACDMDAVMNLAAKHNLFVIEDAAHAIDSYHNGRPLGSIGNFGTFSFHETKNIISGEGGMITVNDPGLVPRAEILWEKGTNRAAFYRGEVDKYNWVDIGSSFLPSDAVAGFLYTQLVRFDRIQEKRKKIWHDYYAGLKPLEDAGKVKLPVIPSYATVNGNMFFILAGKPEERGKLISHLNKNGIQAVFHYMPLHRSPFFTPLHDGRDLPNTQRFSDCIVRLPFFNTLTRRKLKYVVKKIREFYG